MKRVFFKYNYHKRKEIIRGCLLKDPKYREDSNFPFSKMYDYTNKIIEMYGKYSFHNPIISSKGCCVYFKPEKRDINREGLVYSEIKYATHLVTRKSNNQRCCDGSKIKSFYMIKFVIENADIRYDYEENGENKCYLIKRIERNNNIAILLLSNPVKENYYKVLTFMPNQSERQILKKTTPMK